MKKKLTLVVAFVLVFALGVAGTFAYLTSTDTVKNTFTVGNVQINLDETKVDAMGVAEKDSDGNEVRTETGNENMKLLPGHTYVKDPTVTVLAGSEKSYVRMIVTINKASELKAIFGDNFLPQNYVAGWDSNAWPCVKMESDNNNNIVLEFRYNGTVDASASKTNIVLDDLFDSITVPGTVTNAQLATLKGLSIDVVAQAIQADGFTDAADAWNHF